MKILITNDDSISSEVLLPLAKWAKQFGEVTVVVPKYEQSAKSHCIEFRKPLEVKQVPFDDPDIKAYTVDSYPADCVRFAMEGMETSFDFVISGINRGLNIGIDVLYSGTLGAVFEAASFGVPAVALSTKSGGFEEAIEALDEIKDFFIRHELMKKNSLYNINIPIHHKGIRITRMGERYYTEGFLSQGNDMYILTYEETESDSDDNSIDINATMSGYISVTPLTLDRTNRPVFEELKKLNRGSTMGDIVYRKATIEDCYSIAELKGIVWNTTYKGIYPDEKLMNYDVSKNEQIIRNIVDNPEIEIYVATTDDKIVGFMTCGKPYKPFIHYEQEVGLLYILREYQKQGIGKGFFEIARKQVKETGCNEFVVAVNSQNTNAIQFYLAMGGKIVLAEEKQLRIGFNL